ncbi:MAG TPA: phosphatidylinositol mannoside acyltransferase [Actinomycetota bacterium]|nr:phosphatidylinositol mannoside acyltransferase [Actinomycetota bacterium]
MRGETPKETVAYWSYRSVERVAMALPERSGTWGFEALGRAAYRWMPNLRARVAANQARVLGADPMDARVALATREAFELYARYWFDAFRIRALTKDEFNERMRMVAVEHVDRALEAGRGCICVLPHLGNWDAGGAWFGLNGYRIVAVAEELRPRRLYDLFVHHREELGMRVVGLGKDAHVGQKLKQFLADNWMVALVADRDLSGRGIEVEMFGAPRKVPAGPALLSITSGAPIVPAPTATLDRGWEVRLEAPLEIERTGNLHADVVALSRLMAERFERAIAARPTDWHMFQPAWEEPSEPATVEATTAEQR